MLNNYKARHTSAAWAAGVTTLINSPQGTNLIKGLGVAFHSYGPLLDDAMIEDEVALHATVGNDAKAADVTSITSQMARLRSLFEGAAPNSAYKSVVDGTLPLVVNVQSADHITSLVRLKVTSNITAPLILLGASEAPLVAEMLAQYPDVHVILNPTPYQPPNVFETYHTQYENNYRILKDAGVSVAISIEDPGNVRNLRWFAGSLLEKRDGTGAEYSKEEILASVTTDIADMFKLGDKDGGYLGGIYQGKIANFVALSSDWVGMDGYVKLAALDTFVDCNPEQF